MVFCVLFFFFPQLLQSWMLQALRSQNCVFYISLYLDSLLEREKENLVACEKPACEIMGNLLPQ